MGIVQSKIGLLPSIKVNVIKRICRVKARGKCSLKFQKEGIMPFSMLKSSLILSELKDFGVPESLVINGEKVFEKK